MVSSMGFPWNSESLSGKALDYFVLDVFTSRRLEGNALAVMLHDGSLDDAMMQAIARETNLSETTFVDMPSLARSMAALCRTPYAGHREPAACDCAGVYARWRGDAGAQCRAGAGAL